MNICSHNDKPYSDHLTEGEDKKANIKSTLPF
jgi:hypothetical protein